MTLGKYGEVLIVLLDNVHKIESCHISWAK